MRKYILSADLHIRSNRPIYRKDDYWKTVCRKFRQIIYLCNKYDADLIVAGDFFDHTRVGFKVVNTILKYIKKLKGKVLCVAGQHDQVHHKQDLKDSPLFNLVLSGQVALLDKDIPYFDGTNNIYGCSFGNTPIKPETENNILVIHKAITPEEPPFYLTEAYSAEEALNKWEGYFLIVSGDFHESFIAEKWGNVLVNCGPMMRQSIDQTDLKPKVYLMTPEEIKNIRLKIDPPEEVFALEDIRKRDSKLAKGLDELVDTLKDSAKKPDYKNNVDLLVKKGNVSEDTKDKINSIYNGVLNG